MYKSGSGIYFDGVTSRRHPVSLHLEPNALRIMGEGDPIFVRWPYGELLHLTGPEGLLRLGRMGTPRLERVEIRDPDFAAAVDELSVPVDRSGFTQRRNRVRIVGWTLAAVLILVGAAVYGVPALAERLVPYVPASFERSLGAAVNMQVRNMLDTNKRGAAFECGAGETERPGREALAKMVAKLEAAAQLNMPLNVAVLRRNEVNAITLPGGNIYLFEGLIERANHPDELAGVIAHEIGHAANRDGTRAVLQTAGLSFLFGILLGDFVGGGAVVVAAKTLLNSSYTRNVERAADRYAVNLMNDIGLDARALGGILLRMDGVHHNQVKILLDHPDTKERVAAINAGASAPPAQPASLLDPSDWAALKRMCSGT